MSINVETEVKISLNTARKISEIYEAIGRPEWNLQRNYIYRFKEGILRIRYENGKSFLTAKGKGLDSEFNKRPEIECEIPAEFFMALSKLRIFLGSPFYYEKSRASAKYNGCVVCLDNLEGNYYCEIEGSEEDITRNIARFGLEDFPKEKRSYLEMLMEEGNGKS